MAKTYRTMLLFALSVIVTGCASVEYTSTSREMMAKSFTPVADKAIIYVYRKGSWGDRLAVPVMVDSKIVGSNGAGTFLMIVVSPGDHVIGTNTQESYASVGVKAKAGKLYFFEQNIYTDSTGMRVSIESVTENHGKESVLKYNLVKTFE